MKLTEEEIGKKTKKFIHDKIGDYAFLEYMNRIEIWKMDTDGLYELHRTVKNQKSVESVFKIKL